MIIDKLAVTAPRQHQEPASFGRKLHKAGTQSTLLKLQFLDFEELAASAQGWDLGFTQLDRGPFKGDITHLVGPKFQLARARFSRRLYQTGLPPMKLRTFVVPADPAMELFWRGKQLSGNDLMVFPLRGELEAVSGSDFDVFTLSFPEELLAVSAERLGGMPAQRRLLTGETVRVDPQLMQSLRRRLALVQRFLENTERPATAAEISRLSEELAERVLEAWLRGSDGRWRRSRRNREEVIARALRHVRQNADESLTVRALCEATRISERALEYAFQARFGLSPKAFIQSYRLNGVNRELLQADASLMRVADAANQWGFWHMGQFAADYRELFDELPSQTLSRRRAAA